MVRVIEARLNGTPLSSVVDQKIVEFKIDLGGCNGQRYFLQGTVYIVLK